MKVQESSQNQEGDASIAAAIQAMRANRPLRAEEICRDFLLMNPSSLRHRRLLGHSLMRQGRLDESEREVENGLELAPELPYLYEDLGSILAMRGQFDKAVPMFQKALRLDPNSPLAHKKLAEALAALGEGKQSDEHFEAFFERDADASKVALGVDHLKAGRADQAIATFRELLRGSPNNVDAMRFLAVAYWQEKKQLADAEAWLRRAVQIAPDFLQAWLTLGAVLLEFNKEADAIDAYRHAAALAPEDARPWSGLGSAAARMGDTKQSVRTYQKAVELRPNSANLHMSFAHSLKTLGDQEAAVAAYRRAIERRPEFGEAYWSMANLKVFRFEDAELDAMREQLERSDLSASEEVHFRFALAKALEDRGVYDEAWHYFDSGNRRKRPEVTHDPLEMEKRHQDIMEVFTREFIEAHEGLGDPSPAPIFVVGLPRSGSTLVEQILASHSMVEGTSELPILSKISASVGRYRSDQLQFPQALEHLRRLDWRGYGQTYLEEAADIRLTDCPVFTDKMPNNFPLVGLIHLILPNAKVINARRHPLDTCLGCYKQLFAKGQTFTYDLDDLIHYYARYDAIMKHWRQVLPGKVLDVHLEETVASLEMQVRRILEHCELPFEEGCVRFHETRRAVRTASSEQVRQPITEEGIGRWRNYERQLSWVGEALAEIIEALPEGVRGH